MFEDFSFNPFSFIQSEPAIDMGGQGVLAPTGLLPENSFFDFAWSPTLSSAPQGVTLIDQRSATSFLGFDQSKITAGIQDVLGSVLQAGAKSAVQYTGDLINTQQKNPNTTISSFFKNFTSTKTGAEINAGSMAFSVQNWLANPMLWVAVVAGGVLFLITRK